MQSIRFGKILGISLELHFTFILMILVFVVFLAVFDPQGLLPTLMLLFFLFVSVFIHELCHSVVAVWKGIKVSKITLLPIGGLSMTDEIPEKPSDEFLIAVAGPLFNFVAVAAVLVVAQYFPQFWPQGIFQGDFSEETFNNALFNFPLFTVFWVNLILGAFNLFVPALPLDGGRIFRAVLAWRIGFSKATNIAAALSKIISGILFLLGFFSGNFILSVVAIFIFLGANQEVEINMVKQAFKGLLAKDAVTKKLFRLKPLVTAEQALEKMLEKKQNVFLVDSHQLSFVSVEMLSKVKATERDFVKVDEIARPVKAVDALMPLEKAFSLMLAHGRPFLAVKEKGKTIGVLFDEDVQKVLRIKRAEKEIS